jgi:hypothetical protein
MLARRILAKKSRLEGGSGVNREASNRVDRPLESRGLDALMVHVNE